MASRLARLFVADEASDRRNNINVIRFIAASAVIYGHMAHLTGLPVPQICGEEVSSLAVKVFFVLSGYLIAQSYQRDPDPFRYLVRRVFRIFPGLIFVTLASVFVLGPLLSTLSVADYLANPGTWRYLLNCLMNPQYALPGVFADNVYPNAVNGSLWTLPVEFSMYLILPVCLVALRGERMRRWGTAAIALGSAVASVLQLAGVVSFSCVVWGSNIADGVVLVPYFFIGSFLAVCPGAKRFLNVQVAFLLLLVMASVNVGSYWKYELFVLALLPYVTFAFSLAEPARFGRVFAEHDYSYGVYLWAFPVQQTLVHFLGAEAFGLMVYSLLAFCLTLPCAMVSWFAVERPASRLGRRLTAWSRRREELGRAA